MNAAALRPSLLDRLDLLLLRLAKRRRADYVDSDEHFYEKFFTEDDLHKYSRELRITWRACVLRRLFDRCFPSGDARVVDVGCGLAFTRLHLPSAAHYVGVDISSQTLELARKLNGGASDLRVGGFPTLPVESGLADFAICLEVLEHIVDDRQAAQELRRITKVGGFLLLSVPSTYFWPQYERLIGHHRHYSRQSLTELLNSSAFEILAYLPQHNNFWRGYYYACYEPLKLAEAVVRSVRPGFDVFATTPYRLVERVGLGWLEHHWDEDDPRSSFVLCRAR
jgi:SAM-dependent methyltransferase